LYGDLFSNSSPFWVAAFSSSGVRAKPKWTERLFFLESQAIEKRVLCAHTMPEHDVT